MPIAKIFTLDSLNSIATAILAVIGTLSFFGTCGWYMIKGYRYIRDTFNAVEVIGGQVAGLVGADAALHVKIDAGLQEVDGKIKTHAADQQKMHDIHFDRHDKDQELHREHDRNHADVDKRVAKLEVVVFPQQGMQPRTI